MVSGPSAGGGSGNLRFSFYSHRFPLLARHSYGDGFGAGRGHQGQDIFAKCGSPVVAARAGRVQARKFQSAAGYYVVIDGKGTGQDYVYMHMRKRGRPREGSRVAAGQRIGIESDTGDASGCHLHFELWTKPGWYEGGRAKSPDPGPEALGQVELSPDGPGPGDPEARKIRCKSVSERLQKEERHLACRVPSGAPSPSAIPMRPNLFDTRPGAPSIAPPDRRGAAARGRLRRRRAPACLARRGDDRLQAGGAGERTGPPVGDLRPARRQQPGDQRADRPGLRGPPGRGRRGRPTRRQAEGARRRHRRAEAGPRAPRPRPRRAAAGGQGAFQDPRRRLQVGRSGHDEAASRVLELGGPVGRRHLPRSHPPVPGGHGQPGQGSARPGRRTRSPSSPTRSSGSQSARDDLQARHDELANQRAALEDQEQQLYAARAERRQMHPAAQLPSLRPPGRDRQRPGAPGRSRGGARRRRSGPDRSGADHQRQQSRRSTPTAAPVPPPTLPSRSRT